MERFGSYLYTPLNGNWDLRATLMYCTLSVFYLLHCIRGYGGIQQKHNSIVFTRGECGVGRLNMQESIVSFHRKFSIRGRRFYEDCRFHFSKITLGTVWFLAKTVLFFPRHVLLQLITDLDESSQNRCKDMFYLIGNGQSVIDRCIAVLTLSQRHTAICK